MDMPACYGASYREAMRSDPAHMNLRDHSEYYFGIGKELSKTCAAPPTPPPAATLLLRRSAHPARCAGLMAQSCSIMQCALQMHP